MNWRPYARAVRGRPRARRVDDTTHEHLHVRSAVNGLLRVVRLTEDAILVGVLAAMILLGGVQILLRNTTGEGFVWAEPLLRVLVLWAALVGAMVAARDDTHIRIDLLRRFLPAAVRPWLDRFLRAATAVVSFAMAWAALRFVQDERELGLIAFGDVPAWVCESIMPIAFTVLGLRYALLAVWPPPAPDAGEHVPT